MSLGMNALPEHTAFDACPTLQLGTVAPSFFVPFSLSSPTTETSTEGAWCGEGKPTELPNLAPGPEISW